MKKIPTWIIVTIVIALLIASKFLFFAKKEEAAPSGPKGGGKPVAVNYYVVKQSSFSNDVFTTGKIGAINQIDILPEVNGKVTAIYFKEGETVSKGSVLVKLNDADLQAQLLKNKSQIKLAEQKLERIKKLIAINGVSQEEYEAQDNELNSLKADQAYISAQIAKTTIVAPFSGVIGLKNISEGSFVNATTPIASLVQLNPLYVEFSIPEKYSSSIKKGTEVKFSNEGSESDNVATIYAIEPKVDELSNTIKVRAIYSGKQTFYPGSFVKVFSALSKDDNALMIPSQSVISTMKGQKVFVIKNGLAAEVMVKIGVRTDEQIQITEGLSQGDSVIVTGLLAVKKDSKLKLLKAIN